MTYGVYKIAARSHESFI